MLFLSFSYWGVTFHAITGFLPTTRNQMSHELRIGFQWKGSCEGPYNLTSWRSHIKEPGPKYSERVRADDKMSDFIDFMVSR